MPAETEVRFVVAFGPVAKHFEVSQRRLRPPLLEISPTVREPATVMECVAIHKVHFLWIAALVGRFHDGVSRGAVSMNEYYCLERGNGF